MTNTYTMKAMVLKAQGQRLEISEVPLPEPGQGQVLIRVHACGICRTDLHIMDGELDSPALPLIPGHEIVGTIRKAGTGAKRYRLGERVGVPWLSHTCGRCRYCKSKRENLCENPLFTGYTVNGGFAEYTVADEDYCFAIPPLYGNAEAAPLLCAGLIGYRSYRMIDPGSRKIGIFGFGAAAHIITQIAVSQAREIFAFTRPQDRKAQDFALRMGATWASGTDHKPPTQLDAAIIFAPEGALVPLALSMLRKGGTLVCGGIHMSEIPSFQYRLLWEERSIKSVANLERKDGEELMEIAPKIPVRTSVTELPLDMANEGIAMLRGGRIEGAVVLTMD